MLRRIKSWKCVTWFSEVWPWPSKSRSLTGPTRHIVESILKAQRVLKKSSGSLDNSRSSQREHTLATLRWHWIYLLGFWRILILEVRFSVVEKRGKYHEHIMQPNIHIRCCLDVILICLGFYIKNCKSDNSNNMHLFLTVLEVEPKTSHLSHPNFLLIVPETTRVGKEYSNYLVISALIPL